MRKIDSPAVSGLVGIAVADAVGVPYEFKSRGVMSKDPAVDMRGFGTHNQSPGTWSDDTSLTLCLAESLLTGYHLADMAERFVRWRDQAYMTAHYKVFDIGNTTNDSISELKSVLKHCKTELLPGLKHFGSEHDNGNGALMRIFPLLFYIRNKPHDVQFNLIWEAAALTHKHVRSAIACFIYLKFAEYLLHGEDKDEAYEKLRDDIAAFFSTTDIDDKEQVVFSRLIFNDIREETEDDLDATGYVLHTVEAAFWCFLKTDDYESAVLSAVNLGEDTDTTAAVTGGLAGLYYGEENIPKKWRKQTARINFIRELGEKLDEKYPL